MLRRFGMLSKVKNPKLAKQGKLSYEWARSHMQILDNTLNRLKKSKPLKGITLGFCLHITKETSVLLIGAKELGATVAACGGNPLTTQDDIAAFLAYRRSLLEHPFRLDSDYLIIGYAMNGSDVIIKDVWIKATVIK